MIAYTMAELYMITGPSGMQYVGATTKTAQERWKVHVGDARKTKKARRTHFYNSIIKHGSDEFKVQTLLIGSWEYVIELEDPCILAFGTMRPDGYNSKRGGPMDFIAREKANKKLRGRSNPSSSRTAKAMHARDRDKPEYHERQRKAAQAMWNDPQNATKVLSALAKDARSEEGRKRRSENMKRLRQDPEFNKRLAASKRTPEFHSRHSKKLKAAWVRRKAGGS